MKLLLSIFYSFIIVFSNSGVYKSTHLCGGVEVLSEYNISGQNLSCGSDESFDKGCGNELHFLSAKKCCSNENIKLSIEDNFEKKLNPYLKWFYPDVIQVFSYKYIDIRIRDKSIIPDEVFFLRDIPIWHQAFII